MATHYKLEKVKALAENDQAFIYELIKTFLEEIPGDLKFLEEAIQNKNKEQSYQLAHKMKPTIELFGLEYFNALLVIQDWAKGIKKQENIETQLSKVVKAISMASEELKKDYNIE